jgi:hypothetical protein
VLIVTRDAKVSLQMSVRTVKRELIRFS